MDGSTDIEQCILAWDYDWNTWYASSASIFTWHAGYPWSTGGQVFTRCHYEAIADYQFGTLKNFAFTDMVELSPHAVGHGRPPLSWEFLFDWVCEFLLLDVVGTFNIFEPVVFQWWWVSLYFVAILTNVLLTSDTEFTSKKYPSECRLEASNFIRLLCHTSVLTLQMFISCVIILSNRSCK